MSTYGIPDYELGQQRAEAEAGEAFNPISTPMTDAWYKGLSPIMSEAASFSRYLERRLAVVTQERDRYRAALIRLRDCDWTISLPDRMDAVRDIAREALGGDQ